MSDIGDPDRCLRDEDVGQYFGSGEGRDAMAGALLLEWKCAAAWIGRVQLTWRLDQGSRRSVYVRAGYAPRRETPSIMRSSAMVNSMILVTVTGDHDRPDWMITFTGIRMKTIKRTMFGRAGFSLLRARVLHAAWPPSVHAMCGGAHISAGITNQTRKYVSFTRSRSVPHAWRLEEGAHLVWLAL